MKERPVPTNVRTRAQAEAAIIRAKEIQNGDPTQEKDKYKVMLKEVQKKRILLQQLDENREQQAIRQKTLQLQEQMTILQEQLNSL
jgi:hypothetical protein